MKFVIVFAFVLLAVEARPGKNCFDVIIGKVLVLFYNNLFLALTEQMVGSNPCTYGPSYWCANEDNAEKCGLVEDW